MRLFFIVLFTLGFSLPAVAGECHVLEKTDSHVSWALQGSAADSLQKAMDAPFMAVLSCEKSTNKDKPRPKTVCFFKKSLSDKNSIELSNDGKASDLMRALEMAGAGFRDDAVGESLVRKLETELVKCENGTRVISQDLESVSDPAFDPCAS